MTGLHHGARQQLLVSLKRSDSLLVTKCSWPPTSFRPHAKSPVHLSCKKVLRGRFEIGSSGAQPVEQCAYFKSSVAKAFREPLADRRDSACRALGMC
jgi:hypothetical protein